MSTKLKKENNELLNKIEIIEMQLKSKFNLLFIVSRSVIKK